MNLPKISSYGQYSLSNYGINTTLLITEKYDLYYSYETIVAFRLHALSGSAIVRQNDWGVTTGKHLNWIDGGNKKARIPGEQFETMLKEILK